MWYRFAQDLESAYETLRKKGVSEENISKLQGMTDESLRGKYISALFQNPQLAWNDLETKFQTTQVSKISRAEQIFLEDLKESLDDSNLTQTQEANFYNWVERVALPSYRPNQHNPEKYSYPKFSGLAYPIQAIRNEIIHILDWYVEFVYENPRHNIFSISLDDALNMSERWHQEIEQQPDTGDQYTKIRKENGIINDQNVKLIFNEQILDMLNLPDKYLNWMIVKLARKNDFEVEGRIMGHCVGSPSQRYYERYEDGEIEIYSLRSDDNKPHATVEIKLPDTVMQIQGKGDKRPIDPYLDMVVYWIRQNNFYSSQKLSDNETLYLRNGESEANALEKINDFLYPYIDEDTVDNLGVPIRPETKDEDELLGQDMDYMIDRVGSTTDQFYKSYNDIENDEDFDKLVQFYGDAIISKDIDFMKEYLEKDYPLGYDLNYVKGVLHVITIKYKLEESIDNELDTIVRYYNSQNNTNFNVYNLNNETLEQLANMPYKRTKIYSGSNEMKEYDGIYDFYPVMFYNSLYEYIRKNLPREFYNLTAKLQLNLDLSPITPTTTVQRYKDVYEKMFSYPSNTQLKLFDTEGASLMPKTWKYSYNNKKYKLG